MQAVRHLAYLVEKDGRAADQRSKQFVCLFVHDGVERVSRANEDRVEVLVLIEMLLAESRLAVGRVRLAELANRLEPIGAKVRQDVLDPPETVRPWLDLQAHGD